MAPRSLFGSLGFRCLNFHRIQTREVCTPETLSTVQSSLSSTAKPIKAGTAAGERVQAGPGNRSANAQRPYDERRTDGIKSLTDRYRSLLEANRTPLIAIIVGMTALIALLDFWTSAEFVGSILFTFPLASCAMQRSKRMLWGTGAACALLTVAGEFWGLKRAELVDPWVSSANRALLIASFLTLTIFIHFLMKRNRKIELDTVEIERQRSSLVTQNKELKILAAAVDEGTKELALANQVLEQQVEERTAALQSEITDRRRAQEVAERLAAVVESSDDAIISKMLDGTITAWNRGAEKVFGYSSAEAVGKPMTRLLPPERAEEEADILARISRGESVQHFDTVRVRKGGKKIDVSVTISPMRDSTGTIVGASKIARDITARKRAEVQLAGQAQELVRRAEELAGSQQALETQTLMLQSVLESMGEGLIAADKQGHFLIWNDSAKRLMGREASDLPTEQWTPHYKVFLHDGITPCPPDRLPLVRALHGESVQVELMVEHPDRANRVCLEVTARPMKDNQGNVGGGVAVLRDITERKAAEREIQALNQELETRVIERTAELKASNNELEAFTYSVSHDLRAPLRHISGFTKIVVEKFHSSLPAEAHQYLQLIEQGAHRMGQLVDELLKLARLGRQPLAVEVTGLSSLVEDVVTLLAPETEGREVTWKIDELPFVECDPILIRQVFQNLISNALKYSRPRSPAVIEIGQTEKEEGKAFFVKDNGVGFDMKYMDKLFGVFQRLHLAEEFEGTGIGLATVERIIKKHGGRVWAEAELDRGATFYFTLGGQEHPVPENAAAAAGGSL
jgi:PAS domain S-box-containing protein